MTGYDIMPGARAIELRNGKINVRGDNGLLATVPWQDHAELRLPPPRATPPVDQRMLDVVTRVSEDLLTQVAKSSTKTQKRISAGFTSYLAMTWMLFFIGATGFAAALVRGFTADSTADAVTTAVYGGLSVTSFVAVFLSQPVRAMSKAGPEAAWVLAIVNTYWTKLAYVNDPHTVVADLNEAQDALSRAFTDYLRLTGQTATGTTSNHGSGGSPVHSVTPQPVAEAGGSSTRVTPAT